MSAIENCRTAALGGHVEGCDDCGHRRIAYNSCRNRHCPKCQGAAARTWLAEREADLLPVGYFHVVFTLPAEIADIAWQNKAVVYDLLFRAASETMMTIAADPKHLGARIGITAVLHTWGSAMTHHPHVHMIVPGGGISPDGTRWITVAPGLPPAGAGAGRALPPPVPHPADRAARGRQAGLLRRPGRARRPARASCAISRRSGRSAGWSMPSRRSPAPRPCSPISSRYTHRVAISNRRPDRLRRGRRHLPLQGLPPRRPRAAAGHDARDRRVHPPLPAPCPAARLPPHPALRPARQRRPARPASRVPASCWPVAPPPEPVETGEPARSAPALSLLRRAHDHHRDLRALEAAPRAARSNRGAVVTRHGSFPRHAVAMSLRQTAPCAPTVALASSLALIPAAIVEHAYQRSQISVVIARKCHPDAHP